MGEGSMTTHDVPLDDEAVTTRAGAWRAGATVTVLAIVADLLLYLLAGLAGADFTVATGGRGMEVGPLLVVANVAGATLLGTLLLAWLGRRGARAWRVLAWVGLAVGVLSVIAPLTATASPGARLTLAAMHLVTGAVWYRVVARSARGTAP